ncbi:YbhB/YbcL family Raf kinase inhibitor-like protein [Candidatus Woesearchaeota archaeon CG10_big_fil_rev_8_21_14_0_10_37_12]|nr:MAG: YbhB/YbcL family Raf kinase inhibitor-like protein [Candidatus Woesearchaeota archaeon CG10_big_fil_rev_8_21_14_0_10_37_12]
MKIEFVFENNGKIPAKYTCNGENIIPPLQFQNIPEQAKSLVLIVDDPDIPDFVKESRGIEVFDHWVIFNIPSHVRTIEEGKVPEGIQGKNSAGNNAYTGPCPPDREHRYFFKLYALDITLNLSEGATKTEVERAMQGHILEQAELIGLYEQS